MQDRDTPSPLQAGSLQEGVRGGTALSGRCVLRVMPPGGGGVCHDWVSAGRLLSPLRGPVRRDAEGCSEPAKVGGCLSGPGLAPVCGVVSVPLLPHP